MSVESLVVPPLTTLIFAEDMEIKVSYVSSRTHITTLTFVEER
jgi:hypothetical protein